jgi:hypothetical protein
MATEYKRILDNEGKTLYIINYDEDCYDSPREDDNLGTMLCFHRRYNLGDSEQLLNKKGYYYDSDNYDSWDEMEKAIKKENDIAIILPLWLHDHSGISMSFGRTCSWDSGQVGFIFIDKETIRKEYNCKRINKKLLLKVEEILKSEVKYYDTYLRGEVYNFVSYELTDEILKEVNEKTLDIDDIDIDDLEMLDSVCNFIGSDWIEEAIQDNINWAKKRRQENK